MMPSLTKFAHGHAFEEGGKITYFISNPWRDDEFLPLDLSVLEAAELGETKDTGRKFYEAYRVTITQKSLRKVWRDDSVEVTSSVSVLRDALNGSDMFRLKLKILEDELPYLEIRQVEKDGDRLIATVHLEKVEVVPSVGRMLETVIVNLMKTAKKNEVLDKASQRLKLNQQELESKFRELVHEKAKMQDRLIRAFTKVLNTKKKKTRELQRQISALKKRGPDRENDSGVPKRSKNDPKSHRVFGPSSSEAGSSSDHSAITDYDDETDVNDSDNSSSPDQPKSSGKIIKDFKLNVGSATTSEPKPGCRKNLFLDRQQLTATVKEQERGRPNLFLDSETDSSQEMILSSTPLRSRKLKEKPLCQAPPIYRTEIELLNSPKQKEMEFSQTQYVPVDETIPECQEGNNMNVDEEVHHEQRKSACDGNSNDILDQLFALDSQ